ncbi:MAG: nucleoside monophosphate kinase [Candidatus Paceibacterota bacterium]|jgi:adenylate kinase family enzyme
MTPQTFIFVGRSGCGKGTQGTLLKKYLEKNDPKTPILDFQTGEGFRSFIKRDNYSASIVRAILGKGERAPEFLAIWIWSQIFVDKITGKEHVVADGFPRALLEAQILDTALKFYQMKTTIIYIKLSEETAKKRMLLRGRNDDTESGITERMAFYEKDVVPVIEFFRNNKNCKFVEVDGEPSPEEIHNEVVSQLFK